MKKLLLLICLISWQGTSAQNWEIIQPGVNSKFQGEWHYYNSLSIADKLVKATLNVYPDSIITQGNFDFIYLRKDQELNIVNNAPFWGNNEVSIGLNQPGRFGNIAIKSILGDYQFINHCGDTILIQSKAELNQSWIFAPVRNNRYLEATVIQVQAGTVLGVADSIKTIQIVARNAVSQILPNDEWTGKTFQLSKGHGLVNAPAFRFVNCSNFNYSSYLRDTTIYQLKSYKANGQSLGYADIKLQQVFNQSIGDVYHFYKEKYQSLGNSLSNSRNKTYSIEKLISQTYFAAGDSLQLVYQRTQKDTFIYNSYPSPTSITISTLQDTFSKVIHFNKIRYVNALDSSSIDSMAAYFISYDTSFNNRIQLAIPIRPNYHAWLPPSAYVIFCNPLAASGLEYTYQVMAKDIGIVQEYESIPNTFNSCTETKKLLKYFNHNGETWGTPFDTLSILGIEEQTVKKQSVEVFPNPVKVGDVLRFTQTENSEIRIFNLLGHQVGFYQGNEVLIAPAMFQSGIYFWQLTAKDKSSPRGKFLVE